MKWLTATLCLVAILACTTNAMAGRCSGIDPNIITYCDDFDSYCGDDYPGWPGACAWGTPENNAEFRAVWPPSPFGDCGTVPCYGLGQGDRQESLLQGEGYHVQAMQNQDTLRLPRHVHDMTPELLANEDNTNEYDSINGSGTILNFWGDPNYLDPYDRTVSDQPDLLRGQFFTDLSSNCNAFGSFTWYFELSLGDDRAPTNFFRTNCKTTVGENAGPYQSPMVTGDGQLHASFAFGLVAGFDDVAGDPCDVDNGRKPTTNRMFIFDGLIWNRVQGPLWGLPVPDDADFRGWVKGNMWRFSIGTDYIELRLYNERATELYNNTGTCTSCGCIGGIPGYGTGDAGTPACDYDWNCHQAEGHCDNVAEYRCVGGSRNGRLCSLPDPYCPGDPDPGTCELTNPSYECFGGQYWDWAEECTTDDDCPDLAAPLDPLIPEPYFVVRVPRQYTGPFNKVSLGAGKGVDLTPNPKCETVQPTGACAARNACVGGIYSATADDCGSGLSCTADAECPPSRGSCPPAVGTCDIGVTDLCVGGSNHRGTCTTNEDCPDLGEAVCYGSANHGGACTQTCPDGYCNAQGQCVGGANAGLACDCPDYEEYLEPLAGNNMWVDEVVMWDGVFEPGLTGACCRDATLTCEDSKLASECESPDVWHQGKECVADDIICCADPFADADNDGDVDQADFGIWQACFSGDGTAHPVGAEPVGDPYPCACFNRDGPTDVDVDGTDFTAFNTCWSGPTVPTDDTCDD